MVILSYGNLVHSIVRVPMNWKKIKFICSKIQELGEGTRTKIKQLHDILDTFTLLLLLNKHDITRTDVLLMLIHLLRKVHFDYLTVLMSKNNVLLLALKRWCTFQFRRYQRDVFEIILLLIWYDSIKQPFILSF